MRALGDQEVLLAVTDDGVGMPDRFDIARATSLGLKLVATLVQQLDGRLEIVRDQGTGFRLTFQLQEGSSL